MELKQNIIKSFSTIVRLLIVPCGIETDVRIQGNKNLTGLLIVPCGIETTLKPDSSQHPLTAFNRTLWN